MRLLTNLPALLPALFPAAAWFLATDRLMHRSGAHEAAAAAGLIVAVALAITLWRSGRHDLDRQALADGSCPRCRRRLPAKRERLASAPAQEGYVSWHCPSCGYRRAEALTRPSPRP